ncbi:MAG: response regulator [Lautropia sp.]|nr:response regulator [Lautropia sp.]
MTISILLIDDHNLFRSGVRQLLERETDMRIVAEAADGFEGVKRARSLKPDVILLDLNMPGMSGLETLQLLTQDVPDSRVIILTVSEETDELTLALRAGACGYLTKDIEAETLVVAIRKAYQGHPVIADSMTAKLVEQLRQQGGVGGMTDGRIGRPTAPHVPVAPLHRTIDTAAAIGDSVSVAGHLPAEARLTTREREIMQYLARGQSNKEIARQLDVAESTVKIHVQNIMKKLNLSSRVQIAVYAVEHGLSGAAPHDPA